MTDVFKWRHYESDIILNCVRWYLRYSLGYRDLEEMMTERGLSVDHSTIFRWVQDYAPELDKRCHPHLKQTNDSWRVDETYVEVRGTWMYLYRAVDSRQLFATKPSILFTHGHRRISDAICYKTFFIMT